MGDYKRRSAKKILPILIAITAIVLIVVIVMLFILWRNSSENELMGVWRYDQYTQYEFSNDGHGCLCVDDVHYQYSYSVSGKTIKLDFTDDVVRDCEYSFSVEDEALVLIGGEGTDKGTYKLVKVS